MKKYKLYKSFALVAIILIIGFGLSIRNATLVYSQEDEIPAGESSKEESNPAQEVVLEEDSKAIEEEPTEELTTIETASTQKIYEYPDSIVGFSISTSDRSLFEEFQFVLTFKDQTKSEQIKLQESDLYSDDDQENKYFSEFYTYKDNISKIEVFYTGTVEYEIKVVPNASSNSLQTQDFPITPSASTFYATEQAEIDYKTKFFSALGLTIVRRDQWGAPTIGLWENPLVFDTNRIVVHHTATGVNADPTITLRAIYQDHAVNRGWLDIGYNYIIAPNGTIYEGRAGGNGVRGAHAVPNSNTIGISILGDYTYTAPPAAATDSLAKLIGYLSKINDIEVVYRSASYDPNQTYPSGIFPHATYNKDLPTACPGNAFRPILPTIIQQAQYYKNSNANLNSIFNQVASLTSSTNYKRVNGNAEVMMDISNVSASIVTKLKTKSRGVADYFQMGSLLIFHVEETKLKEFLMETKMVEPEVMVQPNMVYKPSTWDNTDPNRSLPSDFNSTTHWNLEKINMPEAWKDLGGCVSDDTCGGDSEIIVAVLDTGVAYEDYNYDAGGSYAASYFSGLYIETPAAVANGVYNEGYDRDFDQLDELNGVSFVTPKDVAWEYMCDLRSLSADTSKHCNALESAKENHANDDHGHGTFVTSIIAADTGDVAPNRIVGIAHNVKIMPVKVFLPNDRSMCQDSYGNLDTTCADSNYDYRSVTNSYILAQGINYAVANGADVINLSLGGEGSDTLTRNAINAAVAAGIVVVAASGNYNDDIANYFPASYDNVIAVGASNGSDAKASYSNYGDELDIVAPVGDVGSLIASRTLNCYPSKNSCSDETNPNLLKIFSSDSTPKTGTGTSFAAPQVSAAVALIKSKNATLSVSQVRDILFETATDLGSSGWDIWTGWGNIDLQEALDVMDPPTLSVLTPTGTNNVDMSYSSITWQDTGYHSTVDFYWDTNGSGLDGGLINDCSGIDADDETDSCVFNTRSLPDGAYYVYGCIDNAFHEPVCDYAPGTVNVAHGAQVKDSGKIVAGTQWIAVNFNETFDVVPIVFAQISAEIGSDMVYVDVRNVTTAGFEVRIEENVNSGWDGSHIYEEVSWFAFRSTDSEVQVGNLNVTHEWSSVKFASSFGSIPKLLTFVQSENGSDIVVSEVKNLTTSGFEVALEEPRGFNGEHIAETVGWIAFASITSTQSGVSSSDHNWTSVTFPTPFTNIPVLVAEMYTENGADSCIVDIRSLTKSGFEYRIEEDPRTYDVTHAVESISWLAHEYTPVLSQKGTMSIDNNWVYVRFPLPFEQTPKVIFEITSENGTDTVALDIIGNWKTTFQARLEEDLRVGRDGFHTLETINWYAFVDDQGNFDSDYESIDHNWVTINFADSFVSAPKLFADIATENGSDKIQVDIKNVTNSSFDVRIEEDLKAGWDGSHTLEGVVWVAFETSPVGQSGKVDIDQEWVQVTFDTPFAGVPKIFADIQSENGADTIQVDIKDLTTSGFKMRLEEDLLAGYDGFHTQETVSWWAFE